jgi:hypothetical protein
MISNIEDKALTTGDTSERSIDNRYRERVCDWDPAQK